MLRATARSFLAEHAPMALVRAAAESPLGYSAELWREISRLGWPGLIVPEPLGGAGLSIVDVVPMLEECGRALAPIPLLSNLIGTWALLEVGAERLPRELLRGIADGSRTVMLAITEEHGDEEPAHLLLGARKDGSRSWLLSGVKRFVPDGHAADCFAVVARIDAGDEPGLRVFVVPRDAAGVSVTPLHSIDPLRRLCDVRFANVRVEEEAMLGSDADTWPHIRRVLDRALVMIAAEMIGGAERCLEDSVRYAKERLQFGKPIGVHQAIKHKCADMLFELESARSIAYYAAWAAREEHEEAPLAAAMAKAQASDAYRRIAAENIQIHGGVGFTWDSDCHFYLKRAKSDETWLGDAKLHRERVATMLRL